MTIYRQTVVVVGGTARFRGFQKGTQHIHIDLFQSLVNLLSPFLGIAVYTSLEVHWIPVLYGRQGKNCRSVEVADLTALSVTLPDVSFQVFSCFRNVVTQTGFLALSD